LFAWLGGSRLARDYERLQATSKGLITLAMINLMIYGLAPEA